MEKAEVKLHVYLKLRVVPHFSSGIVERAKRECVSPFLAWVDFHACSRFARSTIPEEKWGTTRSLELFRNVSAHEFYRLKALITLEQVNTTEWSKKNKNLN